MYNRFITLRGIIVYMSSTGTSNSRVGVYTEEGMIYATAYGAKNARSILKGAASLFVMGRFSFERGRNDFYKLLDIQVYDNGFALSKSLPSYYVGCVCAELVRILVGSDHVPQFKVCVDVLLYLIKGGYERWREALVIFLQRSLVCNGWQLDFPHETQIMQHEFWEMKDHTYIPYNVSNVSYIHGSEVSHNITTSGIIHTLLQSKNATVSEAIVQLSQQDTARVGDMVWQLLDIWQRHLGRVLATAEFVLTLLR